MCYLIIFNTLYTYIHNKELSRSCGLKQNVKTAVNKYSKGLIDCLFFLHIFSDRFDRLFVTRHDQLNEHFFRRGIIIDMDDGGICMNVS